MKSKKYSQIKKYYDDYGTSYDEERIEGYYQFINEIEIEAVREYGKNKRTLEIGCGTGIILNEVTKFAKDAQGIDLSSGMLNVAKKKGLKVKQVNATEIPFDNKYFDVIYSFKVLAHIPEIEKVIEEVHRTLKNDGTAILEFYNPSSFKYVSNKLSKSERHVFLRFDSLKDIKTLLGERFEITDIRGARIITFTSFLIRIPILGKLIAKIEKLLSTTILNKFAGYLIIVAKKK